MAGLLLLSSSTHWGVSLSLFWFLAAAATLGVQLAVHRHFAQSIPPTWLTCIQLAVTGLLGTLLSLLTEQWPASISSGVWGWFAASVLIATTLRYWLLTHALSRMTTAHAALLMLLEPVWTLILSTFFYDEPLGAAKLTGVGLVLGALVLLPAPPAAAQPQIRSVQRISEPAPAQNGWLSAIRRACTCRPVLLAGTVPWWRLHQVMGIHDFDDRVVVARLRGIERRGHAVERPGDMT